MGSRFSYSNLEKEITKTNKEKLTVFHYNVFCRPISLFWDYQKQRCEQIINKLSEKAFDKVDVVSLCELFDLECLHFFIKELSSLGFKYHTKIVGSRFVHKKCVCSFYKCGSCRMVLCDGGIILFSRHRIVNTYEQTFDDIIGTDALVAKGFVYAKINKQEKYYHVIATHLQAWNTKEDQHTRTSELNTINTFINNRLTSSLHEPLIIVGDLNVDYHTAKKQFIEVLDVLKCKSSYSNYQGMYTSDPENNSLVGRDGAKKPYKRELLDYILYSTQHQTPTSSHCLILTDFKSVELCACVCICTCCFKTDDLSDHFPVLCTFKFGNHIEFDDDDGLFKLDRKWIN